MSADLIARAMAGKGLQKIATLGTALNYKGAVETSADLPADAASGDVYIVNEDGKSYAYDGSTWNELGPDIDMSLFVLKTDLASETGNSTTTTMSQAAITENFNKLFVQSTQPAHANEGDVWINPEPDGSALPSFDNEEF